jgi:DNA-binding LacI/PurR family transcriptional regulator
MREIAKHAGVSLTTVSRVFNNHPQVNEKTRKLVIEACEKLQYAIDPKLQDAILSAKSGFTKKIAVVLIDTDLEDNAYIKWINKVVEVCNSRHYQSSIISVAGTVSSVYELPSTLRDERCDGMIITGQLREEIMKILSALEIPGVVIGHYPDACITRNFSNVQLNYTALIDDIMEQFIDKGIKRLAYVDENPNNYWQTNIRNLSCEYAALKQLELNKNHLYFGRGPMTGMIDILLPVFRKKELEFEGIFIPDERIAQEVDKLNFMRTQLYGVPPVQIATLTQRFHSGYEHLFIFPNVSDHNHRLGTSAVDLLLENIGSRNKGETWKRSIVSI